MTDLEKRAKNYIDDKALVVLSSRKDVVDLIVDFAKSETTLLSQHILDLQKDKGNLIDKVKELEEELKNKCVDTNCPVLSINKQNMKRIAELEAQIEKMKCCHNCDFYDFRFIDCYYDKECKNKDHWKLRR